MSTREIITLQFGHYANFVGTHWWNIQENSFDYNATKPSEINPDVLHRDGLTLKGDVTFSPRLLLADLKGSLKSLRVQGDLYEPQSSFDPTRVEWHEDNVEIHSAEKPVTNEFLEDLKRCPTEVPHSTKYNLDSKVNVWSDYLYARFHPRSVNVIQTFEHENEIVSFDVYNLGKSLWKSSFFEEEFFDKLRNYSEECDSLQGFQILLDGVNGFSGLSVSCIDDIKDEYERKSILALPLIPSYYKDYDVQSCESRESSTLKDCVRMLNLALCFEGLYENSSLIVPLCTNAKGWRKTENKREFSFINYNAENWYQTSAIIASFLDTISLKYRLKNTSISLSDICAGLNIFGRKFACASLNLPFGIQKDSYLIDHLDVLEKPLLLPITPNCKIGFKNSLETVMVRGIPETILKKPLNAAREQMQMPAYKCTNIGEMVEFYLQCNSYRNTTNVTTAQTALNTSTPYPFYFDKKVNPNGLITTDERPDNTGVKSIPAVAGLHSGPEVGEMLQSLHREASRLKINKFVQFKSAGMEDDDFKESMDHLLELSECYDGEVYDL